MFNVFDPDIRYIPGRHYCMPVFNTNPRRVTVCFLRACVYTHTRSRAFSVAVFVHAFVCMFTRMCVCATS